MNQVLFNISGIVVHGMGLGKKFGMPTANLDYDKHANYETGVFCGFATINTDTHKYMTVINIGNKPSVIDSKSKYIEAHLLDFDMDIYDQTLNLEVRYKIREIQKFDNLVQVKNQVDKDIDKAKILLN